MADRKLRHQFQEATDFQLYTELILQHLQGKTDPQLAQSLPESYRLLIEARAEVRAGRMEQALALLVSLDSNEDLFVQAERSFVRGQVYYQLSEYLKAAHYYEEAEAGFQRVSLLPKAYLAAFNKAQGLFKLGRAVEAREIEASLLARAEEHGFYNILALVQRSLGYQALRHKDWENSRGYFIKAERNLRTLGNLSDASICYYYAVVADLLNGDSDSKLVGELSTRYSEPVNHRADSFKAFLTSYCAAFNPYDLQPLLDRCDEDIRLMLRELLPPALRRAAGVRKGRERNGEKLLTFLKASNGATAEECIEHLWLSKGSFQSLEKRLWTLIYRINAKQKVVHLDADGKYRVY